MAIYPENFEQKTGFDRIRALLSGKCTSTLGVHEVDNISFETDKNRIEVLLSQTEEFRQMIIQGVPFPSSDYQDPTEPFNRLQPKETFLEAEELLYIRDAVEAILIIIAILEKCDDEKQHVYPTLSLLVRDLAIDPKLINHINTIVDEKAQIRNSASAVLAGIRRKKLLLEQKAASKIQQLLSLGKRNGWIPPDVELTIRNGRAVIPVATAYKRKIRGFVHDQSATGQTVFLEPEEVFDVNNEIRELELDERREIIRILKAFADFLRPMIPSLIPGYQMLGKVDMMRAKARLAIEMDGNMPRLHDTPLLQWINARHPLLYLSYKAQKKHVEPFSVSLGDKDRVLVISGPNAGGKSVCLKACGLIQYMLQCGLLVPMREYSEAGVFRQIFIDIGDEQSLENDLSTYSSHLVNMKHFLENSDPETLFLIDEFGTGTEPRIGGAIAEAILDSLVEKNAMGVITTHYANLKVMASKHQGMINGSMLFDTKNMKPLYRLKMGNPGSSFAFEIAKTIGLPNAILSKAEELTGFQSLDFDRQLQDLEAKKIELEEKEKELRSADLFLSELIDKYDALQKQLQEKKSDILIKARQEANRILAGSNQIVEQTIREIRESQASKDQTRLARKKLDSFIEEQKSETTKLEQKRRTDNTGKLPDSIVAKGSVRPGDAARILGQNTVGEVISITGNHAIVSFGNIKVNTPVNRLEKIDRAALQVVKSGRVRQHGIDLNDKAIQFSPNIDIRGNRAEDAIARLQRFIDDALLLGVKQVNILHGKGNGVLREVVRDLLGTIPEVYRFRDEHPDRGGAGITIADLR